MRRFSSSILRKLTLNKTQICISSPFAVAAKPSFISQLSSKPFFAIAATAAFEPPALIHRTFCSDEADPVKPSGPSNFLVIDSKEAFNDSLRKVHDDALPGILYFTAAWCGPCRFMSPVLEKLSESYPHVTTFKIDIDQELGEKFSELSISAVPTLHFFKDGKKASELVGFDVKPLKETMAKLYV